MGRSLSAWSLEFAADDETRQKRIEVSSCPPRLWNLEQAPKIKPIEHLQDTCVMRADPDECREHASAAVSWCVPSRPPRRGRLISRRPTPGSSLRPKSRARRP